MLLIKEISNVALLKGYGEWWSTHLCLENWSFSVFLDKTFGQTPTLSHKAFLVPIKAVMLEEMVGVIQNVWVGYFLLHSVMSCGRNLVELATEAASRDGKQYCFERCRCSIQVDGKFQNFETCSIQNAKLINWSHM